jgi:hypothetical protein
VLVPSHEIEKGARGIDFAYVSNLFRIDFGIVPTMWIPPPLHFIAWLGTSTSINNAGVKLVL